MAWGNGQCCSTIGTVAKELQSSHWTVDQTIDDLIRTGPIAKEQCWRKNSRRGCLLFSLRGNEKNRNATKGEVRPPGGIRDMSGWRMQ